MATVTAWAKPGAWALDSEEQDAVELLHQQEQHQEKRGGGGGHDSPTDFPSLAVAASSKTSKKKKSQPLSLAEFTTGKSVSHGAAKFQPSRSASKGPTSDELLLLPTGPRERTAEELERSSSRGFNYSSGGNRSRNSDEDSSSRWGSSRVSDESRKSNFGGGDGFNRDSGPSRADEVDNWGTSKRSMVPSTPERRERGGGGGFSDSQSRADESDSWISNKSVAPPSDGRRVNSGGGFDGHRERRGGFEMFNKEVSNGGAVDSETWGRKREEASSGGRPRLALQPRSLPLANGSNGEQQHGEQQGSAVRSKALNLFGEARPREEVLAEKGQDWKKIDEKLESVKIREAPPEGPSFGKKGFGMGNGRGGVLEDRTERTWRKPDTADAPPPSFSVEKAEEKLPED